MRKNLLLVFILVSFVKILSYSYNFNPLEILPKLRASESTYDEISFRSPYSDISVSLKGGDRIALITSGGEFNNLQFEYFDPHNRFLYISNQRGYKETYSSISVNEIHAIIINDISPNNGVLVASIIGGAALGSASGLVVDMSVAIANGCNAINDDGSVKFFGNATSIGLVIGGLLALNGSKHHFKEKVGDSIEIPLIGEGKWEIVYLID